MKRILACALALSLVLVGVVLLGCDYRYSSPVRSKSRTGYLPPQPPEQWQSLTDSRMVGVYAQRVVYWDELYGGFYLHLRIKNKTEREIVLDLRDYEDTIRPVAWRLSNEGQPTIEVRAVATTAADDATTAATTAATMFETRELTTAPVAAGQCAEMAIVETLSDRRMDLILDDEPAPSIVRLPAKADVDLFVYASPGGIGGNRVSEKGTLVLDLAGAILATDGCNAQRIVCREGLDAPELMVSLPARPQMLESGSLVIKPGGRAVLSPTTGAVSGPELEPEEDWDVETQPDETTTQTSPAIE